MTRHDPPCFLVFSRATVCSWQHGTRHGHDTPDDIRDPEEGLRLVSKEPPNETLESRTRRKFWQYQFTQWRDWLAGDSAAIPRAIYCCKMTNHPPPQWLCD